MADTVVFGPEFGQNIITDFSRNDHILFDDVFTDFQDVLAHSAQDGADTLITLDADSTIRLTDVSLSSLRASDFLLA